MVSVNNVTVCFYSTQNACGKNIMGTYWNRKTSYSTDFFELYINSSEQFQCEWKSVLKKVPDKSLHHMTNLVSVDVPLVSVLSLYLKQDF